MPQAGKISRRLLVFSGPAFLVTMPGLGKAEASGAPGSEMSAATQDLAARLAIETTIKGQGPFRFVVDTGADRTVLATEVADELNLQRGAPVLVQGIARSVPSVTARLKDFAVGTAGFGDLDAPLLPRRWIGADGYLGLDVLDRHCVIFDFARHKLELAMPRPDLFGQRFATADEAIIHTIGRQGRLRSVECRVDGINASAFVDSGAEVSVGNSPLFNALASRSGSYRASAPVVLTDVTGGSVTGRAIQVNRVHLSGFDFSDSGLVIADLEIFQLWGLGQRPALFIGMDLLRQFRKVSIDYGHQEFRFQFASKAVAAA